MKRETIAGKTILFTFDDGPMANQTVSHTFAKDGSVDFQPLGGDKPQPPTHVDKYEFASLGQDVWLVSYLGTSGYTLTVALDLDTQKLVAFGSNEKSLASQTGHFKIIDGRRSHKSDSRPSLRH